RVHAVQLLAVRVLQVDDLASPDHSEREKTEKGGEHDLAVRAARERSPGGPSGEKRKEEDESQRRRFLRERDSEGDDGRGREKEVAPAAPARTCSTAIAGAFQRFAPIAAAATRATRSNGAHRATNPPAADLDCGRSTLASGTPASIHRSATAKAARKKGKASR